MEPRFSLRWNNYTTQMTDAFGSLLVEEDLVDVTLSCEGKKIKAHRMLLSACSPYFRGIFKENPCQHPVIVFRNVQFADLKAIVEFIYCGEVNVLQEQLESFLNTAEMLEVKGLSDKDTEGEVVETSGVTVADEENMQTSVREQQSKTRKKPVPHVPATTRCSSSPSKKRKTCEENILPDKSPVPIELASEIKKEVEELEIIDENSESGVSDPLTSGVAVQEPKTLFQRNASETSKDTAQVLEEHSTKEAAEDNMEEDAVDPTGLERTKSHKSPSPDIQLVETTTSFPLKKRKTISEEETLLEDEIPVQSEKKSPAVKGAAGSVAKRASLKTAEKGKVQIPKCLVVTSTNVSQVENLFDFPAEESQLHEEAYTALRSEEASTPVHEESIVYSQDTEVIDNVTPGQNAQVEPEIAEEAPALHEQAEMEVPVEESKEPEFDYFGCDVCKNEGKPVDMERVTFSHKCPICPCCCFCPHLLKEHMKVIHGWFNVQRRFTHY